MSSDKPHSINLLATTTMFFMIGMMGTRPLVPILANELHATEITIGIIIALFPFLPFVFSVHVGKVIAHVGYKNPLILSALFGSISLIIPTAWTSLFGLSLSQFLAGVMNTFFVIAAQSYLGQTRDSSIRDKNIMRFSLGVAIGSFVGPLVGGFMAEWIGTSNSFFVLGGLCFLSTILSLFILEITKIQLHDVDKDNRGTVFRLLRIPNVRKAIFLSSLILMGKDIFISFFPLLGIELGLSSSNIGIIVSVNALAGILIRWIMPFLIDKFNRNVVIVISIICSGLFFILLPFFNQGFVLGVISFLLGLGLGLGQPMSISTTLLSLPKDQVSQGLGLRMTANRFTQMSTPILFGIIAHTISMASIFWITGFVYIFGAMKTKVKEEGG